MFRFLNIFFCFLFLGNTFLFAQKSKTKIVSNDTIKNSTFNPLAPSKAAFYSAVFPGAGQAYNKKYWKIPLVYGAIGTGIYFFSDNNTKYNKFRDAYKRRLSGYQDDDYPFLDNTRLIQVQKFYQRNKDISLLVTAGFYILNIVDANVDAHLIQFNVNEKLTIRPDVNLNNINSNTNFGLSFNYNF